MSSRRCCSLKAAAMTREPPDAPILFFDGHCHLCQQSVQWVLRHDSRGRLRFASLQAESVRHLLAKAPAPLPDSLILYDEGQFHFRSEAVLRLLTHLSGPWRLLARAGRLIPRGLRNRIYDWIAAHRYQWFGKSSTCWMPLPEWKHRFLS